MVQLNSRRKCVCVGVFCVIPFGWSFPLRYCNVRYINKPHKLYHCLLTLICMCVCVCACFSAWIALYPVGASVWLCAIVSSCDICFPRWFYADFYLHTMLSPDTLFIFFAIVPRYTVGPLAKVQFWLPYADRDPRRGPGRFARTTVTSVISSGFESIWAGFFFAYNFGMIARRSGCVRKLIAKLGHNALSTFICCW